MQSSTECGKAQECQEPDEAKIRNLIERLKRVPSMVGPSGKPASLHAPCTAADSELLFISSANLTGYALALNMELGVLVNGGDLPGRVGSHFDRLMESGVLRRVGTRG